VSFEFLVDTFLMPSTVHFLLDLVGLEPRLLLATYNFAELVVPLNWHSDLL